MEKSSEVIGEGAYGCVFKPSLPCDGKTMSYKGKLSKWMLTKEALAEMAEYTIISKADKRADFYTGRPTRCTLKQTPASIRAIKNCKLYDEKLKIKSAKQIDEETSLLIIGDGGEDLEKWIRKTGKMEKKEIVLFWREARRLFLGIQTFLKNDLVHHDLKPQNIVYRMENHRVNYIDFGLMRSTKTEATKCSVRNACRSKPHWNYPMDVLLLNKKTYERMGNQTIQQRASLFKTYMTNVKRKSSVEYVSAFYSMYTYIIKREDKEIRNEFYRKYWKGFDDLLMAVKPENYFDFLNKSLSTFDVFGLGLSLTYVLSRVKDKMDTAVVNSMYDLFFNMMTPNVFTRYSAERSLLEYDKVLSKMS
jgi:serine/threonine protein kinase